MSLRCETCEKYINPKCKMEYPNCDNEYLGWRQCTGGCTIKRLTPGCAMHSAFEGVDRGMVELKVLSEAVSTKAPVESVKLDKHDIAGFVDPMMKLKQAINSMAQA